MEKLANGGEQIDEGVNLVELPKAEIHPEIHLLSDRR
jgi:hypothetical protein